MNDYQYGWKLDCDAHGCNPPHRDRDVIRPLGAGYDPMNPPTVEGHPVKVVRRKVGKWEPLRKLRVS